MLFPGDCRDTQWIIHPSYLIQWGWSLSRCDGARGGQIMFLVFGKYSVRAGKLPQQVDSNPWSCYELMVLAIATPCQPLMFWYFLFMASLADHLIWLFEAKENTIILLWAVRLSCINIMCLVPLWMQSVHMCVCYIFYWLWEVLAEMSFVWLVLHLQ